MSMKIRLEFGQHYDRVLIHVEDNALAPVWKQLSPSRSQKVWNHSPDGFSWGYGGSGPAQLALALLLEAGADDDAARELHQEFKNEFVAVWPQTSGEYEVDVVAWLAERGVQVEH